MKSVATFTCLLALTGGVAWAAELGKPAPDFSATDLEGKTHRLSDFRGKIVVLEAYNYDCPFCANHYKTGAMQELQAKVTGQGVVWLLVNSTHPGHPNFRDTEAARKEWDKLKIKATAWLDDRSGAVGKLYDLKTTPHFVVIDAKGTLVYDGAIDDQARADGDPRKAKNHVAEIVGKLTAGEKVEPTRTRPYGCTVKYAS